jgi:hypothetical protein
MKKHYIFFLSLTKFKIKFITLLLIFCSSSIYAQTQGPNDAGIGFTSGFGTNWSNPGSITADDFNYATCSLGDGDNSRYLRGRNYGFTIPAGATINGIQVSIMRRSNSNINGDSVDDDILRLVKNGNVVGNNLASPIDWPTSMAVANYGGATNLWGTTWTPAEINDANFGVALLVENESNNFNRTASVDYIQITVYYTLGITITSFSPTSSCANSGDLITINGTNLSGVTNVYFNGTSASFTIINNTQITATVPSGATSGTISVTSPSGNATSAGSFTIHPLPTVNPITGITDLCPFTATTLFNTSLGGVWSSGDTSVATIDSSGIVSGVSSGSSLITYTVTDGNNCSNSATITVNVTAPPLLSGPTEVCLGNTIQLLPSSGGTWISNNPSVATIDNSGLVSGILLGNSTFTFTDSITGCFATTGTIVVVESPQITLQPVVSQTVCSGNSVSISTSADGAGLTYQWFKGAISLSDGGNISGANTPTLTLNPVSLLDDGTDYYCEITGNCTPSVTTDFATIIVNENVAIGTQPIVTQTLCSNDTATFSVIANGTGLTYQWYNGVTALTDDAFISGATTASLSISSLSPANSSTEYYCIVSGTSPCNPVTSDYSILIVNDIPAITLEPAITQTVCAGESVDFIINATGGNLIYQWYKGAIPLVDGGNISGSNTPTLSINPTISSDSATDYHCIVSNGCNPDATTINATLVVNEEPTIFDQVITICSEETFVISPINGDPDVTTIVPSNTTYSWSAPIVTGGITGGTAQSGESQISDTLINPTDSVQTATYTVTPTSGTSGSCVGNSFTIVVTVNPKPYSINVIDYVCSEENFNIVPTNGGGNIIPTGTTFSWGLPTVSGGITGGTAESGLLSLDQTLTNPTNTVQTATYNVTANSGLCIGSTFTITLFVHPKPTVSATPVTQEICSGEAFTTLNFSNPNNLSGTIIYNWTRDNDANVTGMPTSGSGDFVNGTLFNATNTVQTANFTVYAVSDEGCFSDTFVVSIDVKPIPTVDAFPLSQSVCSEENITQIDFLNPNNVTGTTYSWTRDNTTNLVGIPSNGTGTFITGSLTNLTDFVQTTTFTIIASADGCASTSATFSITVNPTPTVDAIPLTQTVCGEINFSTITISNPNNIAGTTYTWVRDNTTSVTGLASNGSGNAISGTLVNTTNIDQTVIFTITASANGCLSDPLTIEVIVQASPLVLATPTSQNRCNSVAINTINLTNPNAVAGTTYSWTRDNTTNLTGIAASGNGSSINGTLTNTTTTTQTTIFTITATAPNGCSSTTTASVSVYATLTAPTINAPQTVCLLSTPAALTITTPVTGGSGVNTYQWQRSDDNVTFTNIGGATGVSYQPPFVNFGADNTFYRLIVTNICGTVTSNVIFVEVVSNVGFTFDLDNIPSGSVCSGTAITPQISSFHFSSSAVRYSWSADSNFVSAASGGPIGNTSGVQFFIFRTSSANIGPLTVQNNTNATVVTPITITPSVYNYPGPPSGSFICSITPQIVNVSIRPRPVATASVLNSTFCSGTSAGINVNGNITDASMSFAWTRNNTTNVSGGNSGNSGNIAAGGTFIIPNTLNNNTASPQTVTYTITPSSNGCTGSAITISVTIAPNVLPGTIASNQTVCFGGDPAAFTQLTPASGLNLTYQWQSSTVSNTGPWTDISGATSTTYDAPGPINQTTWFRRLVISTVNGVECSVANSTPVQITVNTINPGSISGNQTICSGSDPAAFSSVNATGSGTVSYQWQSSTDGCSGTWSDIASETNATLNVSSGLTVTTYYRRIAISTLNGVSCSDFSNCIIVTINEVNGGTLGSDQTLCGNNPDAFTVLTPSTGAGTLTYQWQRNTVGCGGPWTTISGATSATYDPPSGVTVTTYYQRITTSTLNGVLCSVASNCITVTANTLTAGTINGNRTVCDGGDPLPFTETVAATGVNLSYQWQISTTGGAGPWSDILSATDPTYDAPGPITQITYFRRMAIATVNGVDCSAPSNFVTVFVNSVTPSVIDGNQTVCQPIDNPNAFTIVSPASGSGTLSYQWLRSTVGCGGSWTTISGATSATYDPPIVTQTTYYQVRVTSTLNSVPCVAFSNCIEVTSNAKTWLGTINSDWNNPSNWQPNGVPTSDHCVVIQNVANDPIISGTNYQAFANTISLMASADLTIASGNSITVTGWVSVAANAVFEIENNSSLVQIDDVANIGNITYIREASNIDGLDYVYWSSPVANQFLNSIYTSPTQGPKYKWNPIQVNGNGNFGNISQGTWVNANGNTMEVGRGYIVRGSSNSAMAPTTISSTFSGVPNNGSINYTVERGMYTGAPYAGLNGSQISNLDDNWNLLGNPYPSAINALQFLSDNSSVLLGSARLWTHGTDLTFGGTNPFYGSFGYNYSSSDYLFINFTGPTIPTASDFIKTGQAFFVQMVDGPGNASAQVNFNNLQRSNAFPNNNFFRNAENSSIENSISNLERHRIWLDIVNSNNQSTTTLIGYVEGASNDKDSFFDAHEKASGSLGIYSNINEETFAIQGRSLPFTVTDEVPITIKTANSGSYHLAILAVDGLFENQSIYVKDELLNVTHDLKLAPYSFSSEGGIQQNRFKIIYQNETLGVPETPENQVIVYKDRTKFIQISTGNITMDQVKIYDIQGRLIKTVSNINNNIVSIDTQLMADQVLMVTIITSDNLKITKKVF